MWLDAPPVAPETAQPSDPKYLIIDPARHFRPGEVRKIACRAAIEMNFDWIVIAATQTDADAIVHEILRRQPDVDLHALRPLHTSLPLIARLAERVARWPTVASAVGFSTAFLRRVPFDLNSDGELFEAEILLQAAHIGVRLNEVIGPPTDQRQIKPVRGLLWTAVQFRMHRVGMLCALKYRNLTPTRYRDKTFMMYSSHALALDLVRRAAPAQLADIGCGPGFIARRCEELGIRVTGFDAHEPLAAMMSEFHQLDLERDVPPVDPLGFDCVLLLDLLEHVADPEGFLLSLRHRSSASWNGKPPLVIISTPNVAFAAVRMNLLLGRFSYAERGILDITHKRLFTRSSLMTALQDCGYKIERVFAVGAPFQAVVGGPMGKFLGAIADLLARAWPTMFAFQFVVTCRPRPGIRQLAKTIMTVR